MKNYLKNILFNQSLIYKIITFLLIIFLIWMDITSIKLHSFTMDEGNYLDNGEKLAKNLNWDHYVVRFHPPLTFYYHGLLTKLNLPFIENNKLFYARLMMLPILIIFALLVQKTAQKFYGMKAGLLALILFCFDPNILAHGRLITIDLTLAFFIFLFLTSFYRFLLIKKDYILETMITGIILGGALLTKYNGLMLLPLSFFFFCCFIGLQIIRKEKIDYKKFLSLIVIYVLAIFLVNLGYGFISSLSLPSEFKTTIFQNLATNKLTNILLRIFPGIYLTGVDYQIFESQREYYWEFFMGQRMSKGPWYFYPLSFLIKVPIPTIILIGLVLILIKRKEIKKTFFEFMFLFTALFFLVYFSFFNKLINGFRYVLMIFPVIFVLIVQIINVDFNKRKINIAYKLFLALLILWYIVGTMKLYPHFFSYVNEFVGGSKNAYKYYADSNLDWGQNWILLDQFKKQNKENIIDDPKKPMVGKIMVSVNSLNLYNYEDYEWLRKLKKEPIDNIGYTWLIFDITTKDLERLKNR